MLNRTSIRAAILAGLTSLSAAPAVAQGEIVITQAKVIAGGVTPGDTAGFPLTLSRAGAYVLGGNLAVPAGRNGIVVTSHNVDIDMNGFRLYGGGNANVGLRSAFGQSRIHDGAISSFAKDGILLRGNSNAWIVENMQVVRNKGQGISGYASSYSRYLNNTITANSKTGLVCGSSCHVQGNIISGNGEHGVYIASGTVIRNTIFSNGLYGIIDPGPAFDTGFGDNTLAENAVSQTSGVWALFPNRCGQVIC